MTLDPQEIEAIRQRHARGVQYAHRGWSALGDVEALLGALEAEHQRSAALIAERDEELRGLRAALTAIADTPCGIPGHAVAVGCGANSFASDVLAAAGLGSSQSPIQGFSTAGGVTEDRRTASGEDTMTAKADWIDNPNQKHGGEYVVRDGLEIVACCGAFKRGWENAVRIAEALNAPVPVLGAPEEGQ